MATQNSRNETPLILAVMSASIFILAVLFSAIPTIGFYVSLGLVVIGGFAMLVAGIIREAGVKGELLTVKQSSDADFEDILA